MSSKNAKYRNPPTPLGYVKKEVGIVFKYDEEDKCIDDLYEKLKALGVFEGPELSIYKPWISTVPFSINPSSEEEEEEVDDDIVEIPVEPRKVELVVIDDPPGDPEQNVSEPVAVKSEPVSPKELSSVEKDPAPNTSVSSTDPIIAGPEKSSKKKKKKKSHHGKHKKDHKEKTGVAKKYSSDESDDSDHSHNRKNEKVKDNYQSAGHKKKYSSDEDIDGYSTSKRSKTTTEEIEDSDREPHRRVKIKESKNDGKLSKNKRSPSPCSSKIKDNRKDIDHKKKYSSDEDNDYSKKSERKKIPFEENDNESQRSEMRMKKDSKSDDQFSKRKKSPSLCSSKMKDYGKSGAHKKRYSSGEESDCEFIRFGKDKKDDSKFPEKKRSPSPCTSKKKDLGKSTVIKRHSSDEDLDYSVNIKSERNIKREMRPGPLLHGVYRCEVCNLTLNSESTYHSHIEGKRHLKALNAQNASNFDSKAWVPPRAVGPAVIVDKCPKPMAGYYRKKINQRAIIQPSLDKSLKTPCPGLENVVEIQNVIETLYYCKLCNAPCNANSLISHLSGFKHQLNCLKEYRRDLYERWGYAPKHQIEVDLMRELSLIEKRQGRGEVTVEKEFLEADRSNVDARPSTSSRGSHFDVPSTSHQPSDTNFIDSYEMHKIPDPSKPGFYCKLCDSHSNSEAMWRNHIVGKRHLANVRKAPGTAPSKIKYIPAPNLRAYLFDYLEEENPDHLFPVVGLNQIREIQKPDINAVTYNCFLCSSSVTSVDIVSHILSRKHRERYLESIKHPDLELYKSLMLSDSYSEDLISDICAKVEQEMGSGAPEVYLDKSAVRRGC